MEFRALWMINGMLFGVIFGKQYTRNHLYKYKLIIIITTFIFFIFPSKIGIGRMIFFHHP